MKIFLTRAIFISILFGLHSCHDITKKEQQLSENKKDEILYFPAIKTVPNHEVMILGSFHFNRTMDGSDVISKNQIDILSEENQGQLDSLILVLQQFNPSKIAVEWTPDAQSYIDSLYKAYREGTWKLEKNESFQLGFRLANLLNLDKVYCIDNRPTMPETVTEVDDWDEYARGLNQMELYHKYDDENIRFNSFMDSLQNELFVVDYLKVVNSEAHSKRSKQLWFTGLVNLGVHETYLGADLTGHWYRRNTRIFVNASNLVEKEKERILIIYGSAHKWILDEFFDASPEFEVKQLNDYLKV